MYLAAGEHGAILGLVWGGVFGLFEGLMAGRPVVSALFLPSFSWTLYFFYRGAAAAVFLIVSRQMYFHLVVLLLVGGYAESVRRQRLKSRPRQRHPYQPDSRSAVRIPPEHWSLGE